MNARRDGGPALPIPGRPDSCGMTLRDYFAAKAMQGMLTVDRGQTIHFAAEESYRIADAMLAAREGGAA